MMDEGKRLEFTSYLQSEGYEDAFWYSKFWDISEDEAESLLEEAQRVSVSDELSDYIESQRDDLDAPDIVNKWDSPRRHFGGGYNKKAWLIAIFVLLGPFTFALAPGAIKGLWIIGACVIFATWASGSETDSENQG